MTKIEDTKAQSNTDATESPSLVDALFDVGTAWVEYGIGYGKHALESSAKVLAQTAKALEALQEKLKTEADKDEKKAA